MSRKFASWLLGSALLAGQTLAQMGMPSGAPANNSSSSKDVDDESPHYELPDRKEPSMWHSPSGATSAEQLALARRYEEAGRISRAINAYDDLVHKWHNAPEAVLSQCSVARLVEADGDYSRAFDEYQYLISYFPGQFDYFAALDRQYRCANLLRTANRRFLGIKMATTETVRLMYERILLNGPHWEKAPEIALLIGALHEEEKEYSDAALCYERMANLYPGTDKARDGAYRAALCRYGFTHEHPRDEHARHLAITAVVSFLNNFPLDPRCEELKVYQSEITGQEEDASYAQAYFYDNNRSDRQAAIVAYQDFLRRYPNSPHAKTAAARLAKLEQGAPTLGNDGKGTK